MSYTKDHFAADYLALIASIIKAHKERTYQLMYIKPGDKVLDVGCGPGIDTLPMASLVGESGEVHGIDGSQEHIELAQAQAQEAGVDAWTKHRIADAAALPFPDNYFDAARSDRVFQHLSNPGKTLSEMIRVTKSGGRILVMDVDWSTLSIDTTETDVEHRLRKFMCDRCVKNGYMGRRLYGMFREYDLKEIWVELAPTYTTNYLVARHGAVYDEVEQGALKEGIITAEELQRWRQALEDADARGAFFGSTTQMIVVGIKP